MPPLTGPNKGGAAGVNDTITVTAVPSEKSTSGITHAYLQVRLILI